MSSTSKGGYTPNGSMSVGPTNGDLGMMWAKGMGSRTGGAKSPAMGASKSRAMTSEGPMKPEMAKKASSTRRGKK